MVNITWKDVLARKDLVGSDFEIQEGDTRMRGRICEVSHDFGTYAVSVEWTAYSYGEGPWVEPDVVGKTFPHDPNLWDQLMLDGDAIEIRVDPAKLKRDASLADRVVRRIYLVERLEVSAVQDLTKLLDREQWDYPQVQLSEQEWSSLGAVTDWLVSTETAPELPACCDTVSALREAITNVWRQDGYVLPADRKRLLHYYQKFKAGHEFESNTLDCLMEQVEPGITRFVYALIQRDQLLEALKDLTAAAEKAVSEGSLSGLGRASGYARHTLKEMTAVTN